MDQRLCIITWHNTSYISYLPKSAHNSLPNSVHILSCRPTAFTKDDGQTVMKKNQHGPGHKTSEV